MARRVNPAGGPTATEEHEEQTPMAGGSAGVLETASDAIPHPGQATANAYRAPDPDAPPSPPVYRFVVDGVRHDGVFALINGYKALFRNGKVVDSLNYDVEGLRQQGVRLRPLE